MATPMSRRRGSILQALKKETSMEKLPLRENMHSQDSVLLLIFTYVPLSVLATSFCRVCKQWKRVSDTPSLWTVSSTSLTAPQLHALLRQPRWKGVKSVVLDLKAMNKTTYNLLLECARNSLEELEISGVFHEQSLYPDPYAHHTERKEKSALHTRTLCEKLLDLGFVLPRFRKLHTLKFFFLALTEVNPFRETGIYPVGWLSALPHLKRLEFHRCTGWVAMFAYRPPQQQLSGLLPAPGPTAVPLAPPSTTAIYSQRLFPQHLTHLVIKYSDGVASDLLIEPFSGPTLTLPPLPLTITHVEVLSVYANEDQWTKLLTDVLPRFPLLTTVQLSMTARMMKLLPHMPHLTELSLVALPPPVGMIGSKKNVPSPVTRHSNPTDSPTQIFTSHVISDSDIETAEPELITAFADEREAKREMQMSLLPLAVQTTLRTLHIEGFGRIQQGNIEALARLPALEHLSLSTIAGHTYESVHSIIPNLRSFKAKILKTGPRALLFENQLNANLMPNMGRKVFGYMQYIATSDPEVAFECFLDTQFDLAFIGLDFGNLKEGLHLLRRIRAYETTNRSKARLPIVGAIASKWSETDNGGPPDVEFMLPLPPTLQEIAACLCATLPKMSKFC